MWPRRLYPLALVILSGPSCEVSEPVSPLSPNRVVGAEWSLEFDQDREDRRVEIRRRNGSTVAFLRHVRLVLGTEKDTHLLAFQSSQREANKLVLECEPHPDHSVQVTLELDETGAVEVQLVDAVGLRSKVCELTLEYDLSPLGNPEEVWLPHEHRRPDQVAGDSSFHTPVAFLRRGDLALSLVPDWERLARTRPIPEAMEFERGTDQRGPLLRHGLVAYATSPASRGGFSRAAPVEIQGAQIGFRHTLQLHGFADPDTSYHLFRDLWRSVRPQTKATTRSLDDWTRTYFEEVAAEHWIELGRGGEPAGTIRAGLAATTDGLDGEDAWFSARQQTLRTAYGLLLYAERTAQIELRHKAELALVHALTAPARGGLLPSVFLRDPRTDSRRWIIDSKTAGDPEHFHAFDVATTCYWMLRLSGHFPQHRASVLALCRRTARFFQQNQLPSGSIPSFYQQKYLAPDRDRLFDRSAEAGAIARFLTEYGVTARDPQAIQAAARVLTGIEGLVDTGGWRDVESAPEGDPGPDPRSGMPRQGTLGLLHCALAAARFGRLQPDPRWRRLTDRLLGQLSRYQQIWSPPWIPDARIGGFGAGNFDHRWNDARQGLAAAAFFSGYELTQDSQWLERGVAALDAALASGTTEYQPPFDLPGPPASLLWGRGTTATTAELVRADLGGAVIDVSRGIGLGIDAVWVEGITHTDNRIECRVLTRAAALRTTRLHFRNFHPGATGIELVVNGESYGVRPTAELTDGVTVEPTWLPTLVFRPANEINRDLPWRPRVLVADAGDPRADAPIASARIEVRTGTEPPTILDLRRGRVEGMLVATETFRVHRDLPAGVEVRSRLVFVVAGREYAVPAQGYRTSLVSDFSRVDPGESDEAELVAGDRSRIRRFVDGVEFGRHADASGQFTYRIPVSAQATKIEFVFRVAGLLRIRAGDTVLHEDTAAATKIDEARDLPIEIADHRLWSSGEIPLTFESAMPGAGIDVASIRYQSTGRVAGLTGGARKIRRNPDKELRVLVQPLAMLNRPLEIGQEALRLAFFGGQEHVVAPRPISQRATGSVANLIDSLSGGRTTFEGEVLPRQRWMVLASDAEKAGSTLPPEVLAQIAAAMPADVVVVIGPGSAETLPKPRRILVDGQQVSMVFLPARHQDGSPLSTGTAAGAILTACYGIQPMQSPEWGNFGTLVLTGGASQRPPGPSGFNLALTGWGDDVALERRDHDKVVISPLASGRFGILLDHGALPGRGSLYLECRATADLAPDVVEAGVLLYWIFDGQRPQVRNSEDHTTRAACLRLSAVHGRTATPFVPGREEDLFQVAASRLPTETVTGERLWEILGFRMLDNGDATFDIRYRATDLARAPGAKWTVGTEHQPLAEAWKWGEGVVVDREGEVWIHLPRIPDARLRLQTEEARGLFRLFTHLRRIEGDVTVTVGTGDQTLVTTRLDQTTGRRWLQTDIPSDKSIWVDFVNTGEGPARVVLSALTRVPRVQPAYEVRSPAESEAHSVRLDDGVIYGKTIRLPAPGEKFARTKRPVVLPAGTLALRVRAGLPHGAPPGASARLSLTLASRDGSKRTTLLDKQEIRGGDEDPLFLALVEIPRADQSRVWFLEIEWNGATDLHLVDLAIIRP